MQTVAAVTTPAPPPRWEPTVRDEAAADARYWADREYPEPDDD